MTLEQLDYQRDGCDSEQYTCACECHEQSLIKSSVTHSALQVGPTVSAGSLFGIEAGLLKGHSGGVFRCMDDAAPDTSVVVRQFGELIGLIGLVSSPESKVHLTPLAGLGNGTEREIRRATPITYRNRAERRRTCGGVWSPFPDYVAVDRYFARFLKASEPLAKFGARKFVHVPNGTRLYETVQT